MTTLHEPPSEVGGSKQAVRGKRFLVIAVVFLVVALGGLGTRAVLDQESASPDEEIEQLLVDYLTAWETKDEAAARSATTRNMVINEYVYIDDAAELRLDYRVIDNIDGLVIDGFAYDWAPEMVGDLIVMGEGPWYVAVEENWEKIDSGYILEGQASYTIVEIDGELKIANHYWTGLKVEQTD